MLNGKERLRMNFLEIRKPCCKHELLTLITVECVCTYCCLDSSIYGIIVKTETERELEPVL